MKGVTKTVQIVGLEGPNVGEAWRAAYGCHFLKIWEFSGGNWGVLEGKWANLRENVGFFRFLAIFFQNFEETGHSRVHNVENLTGNSEIYTILISMMMCYKNISLTFFNFYNFLHYSTQNFMLIIFAFENFFITLLI